MKNKKNIKNLNDLFKKIDKMDMELSKKVELKEFIESKVKKIGLNLRKIVSILKKYEKKKQSTQKKDI